MLWFFSIRKRANPMDTLREFLNKADEAMIHAYETKQLEGFIQYASNKVLCFVVDRINSKEQIFFGTQNYRTRNWIVLSDSGGCISIKKELRHRHVRLNKKIYVAVGEDVNELWKISITNGRYIIEEIEEVG